MRAFLSRTGPGRQRLLSNRLVSSSCSSLGVLLGLQSISIFLTDLNQQGNNYVRDGNFSQAYLILLRYSTLVIQHLLDHPHAKSPEGKKTLKNLTAQMPAVLEVLEQLKPQVTTAYEEWLKIANSRPDSSPDPLGDTFNSSNYRKHASRDAALSWNPKAPARLLNAGDNQDLAVDLAKQEIKRRDADRKATRQAGISPEEEQARRTAGVWDDWDVPAPRRRRDDADELRRNMDAARRRLDQSEQARHSYRSDTRQQPDYNSYDQTQQYQYPAINKSVPPHPSGDTYDRRSEQPPARPPKPTDNYIQSQFRADSAPPRPTKEPIRPPHDAPPPPPPPSTIGADPKDRYTFRPAAYLEDGSPIRPVFLPTGLRDEFLRLALPNTRKNLEMCGILCGTCVNNALFISHLVIPNQTCTSDTCETVDEEEIFNFCMKEDLLMLGWIHTHPTQSCFMSSRDLHTHSGYQVMMPESIAIVCAPMSEPSYVS